MNNIDILEEELRKDILYQIDMQLYDEFNDKFCEIEENLGTVYSYKDLEDLKKAESDTERTLLREAITTLIAENKELKEKYSRKLIDFQKEREEYEKDYIPKSKVEELLKEIENRNYNDYTGCQDGNEVKYNILLELQSLLGKE